MLAVGFGFLSVFNKLGISLTEQKLLTNVAVDAVFDSVSIGTTFKKQLHKFGVIFCSFSEAVKYYPNLVDKYLAKVVPINDNFFATLKIKKAQKVIAKGDKVKITIRFKGRELQHSSLGNDLMEKIKQDMQSIGRVELQPKFDGKQMIMVIQPL